MKIMKELEITTKTVKVSHQYNVMSYGHYNGFCCKVVLKSRQYGNPKRRIPRMRHRIVTHFHCLT